MPGDKILFWNSPIRKAFEGLRRAGRPPAVKIASNSWRIGQESAERAQKNMALLVLAILTTPDPDYPEQDLLAMHLELFHTSTPYMGLYGSSRYPWNIGAGTSFLSRIAGGFTMAPRSIGLEGPETAGSLLAPFINCGSGHVGYELAIAGGLYDDREIGRFSTPFITKPMNPAIVDPEIPIDQRWKTFRGTADSINVAVRTTEVPSTERLELPGNMSPTEQALFRLIPPEDQRVFYTPREELMKAAVGNTYGGLAPIEPLAIISINRDLGTWGAGEETL